MLNSISQLFGIRYPIIQAGMVWASGWRLASAVSNAGGLGLLGAGSMYPEVLREHIQKCKIATDMPFGVNVPLLYPDIDKLMEIILAEKVKIVFTAAGNPKLWTEHLKSHGCTVVHVVSSVKFALKAQACGVDAIVAEGFEAGGHNGREETTTMTLIPLVKKAIEIPLEVMQTAYASFEAIKKMAEIGNVYDVIKRPKHPYTVGLMNSIPKMGQDTEALMQIEGSMPRLNEIRRFTITRNGNLNCCCSVSCGYTCGNALSRLD